MTRCRVCGAVIRDGMNVCVSCTVKRARSQALKKDPGAGPVGKHDPEAVVCFVCGEGLGPGVIKCNKCGTLRQDHAHMLKWFQKAARDGDDCAQERLADMYFAGIGTDRDYKKALAWYLRSADQGNETSRARLGIMYEEGLGVGQDFQKALALYGEAADAGNALGQARLAEMYYRGIGVEKNIEKALAYFQAAAMKGHSHSQARLGDMYLFGAGVQADSRMALKFYWESAQQGNDHGQTQLAGMYLHGIAVERDYREALAWYRKAAGQNNAAAQANLGRMVEQGLGVDADPGQALELYKKSADQGHALGQARLGEMFLNGSGGEQDLQQAWQWFQKAAEQGHDLAQLRLGVMYCDGRGTEQDLKKGFELLRQAAKQGNAAAQFRLARMYRDGQGIDADNRKAVAWLRKAARQGHAGAQNELGFLYEQGMGVERDLCKAGEWYLQAAEKGLVEAQVRLGGLYRDGRGFEESIVEAKKWFVRAAEKGSEKAQAELLRMELEADPKKKLKNRILAAYAGDARAMGEVAAMYLKGLGVEANEENALEWFKKALEHGNESVRGTLQQLQRSVDARRRAESKVPEKKGPIAVPPPGAPSAGAPVSRPWLVPFFMIGALALAALLFNTIAKARRPAAARPALMTAEFPRHEFELPVPPLLETGPELTANMKPAVPALEKSESKLSQIAAVEPLVVKAEPVAAVLRHEAGVLSEDEISAILGRWDFFDAVRNPAGNFRQRYEIRNAAGLRLVVDHATGLAWIRQPNPVKMSLEKAREWIASLNQVGYGGSSDWRLPTVEEAASLLQQSAVGEKLFLDVVFGRDIRAIWTADSPSASRSWIIDFGRGTIDQAKNKNRLPAMMVSAGTLSSSARGSAQKAPASEN